MLKSLFTSSVRVKLLKHFFLHPGDEFFIRQLTRDLNEQVNAIRRELENWKRIGLLKSSSRGGKKYYCLNSGFLIYSELSSIILKSFVANTDIKKDLENLGGIEYMYLSGIFVDRKSLIDMLIVGDIDPGKVHEYLNAELGDREVKFSVIGREEFNYRLDINDAFLLSVIRDKNSVVLINKLKKKIEKYL